ncbi:hypothetical protein PG999_014624 [Apiospora kogelbergensis]|uniref:Uncharacterized protein n=1 Tax=Apiospora kogelbergensis TaxID=1337665 RepID=A0AAW0Q3X9_9PEZI
MGISFNSKKLQFINKEEQQRQRNFKLGYQTRFGNTVSPKGPSPSFRSSLFPGASTTSRPSSSSSSSSPSSPSSPKKVTTRRKVKNLFIPVDGNSTSSGPSSSASSSPNKTPTETDKKLFTKLKIFTPITAHQQQINDQKKVILANMKAESQRRRELAQQYEEEEGSDDEFSPSSSPPPPSSSKSQSNQEHALTRPRQPAIPRVLSSDDNNDNTPEEVRASIKSQRSAKMQALKERKAAREARSRARALMM